MIGGARFTSQMIEWSRASHPLFYTIAAVLLFLFAGYAEKLPPTWIWQLNTTLGRATLLFLLYLSYYLGGGTVALVVAIAIAIVFANRPFYKPKAVEGFAVTTQKISRNESGNLWFVERVLHENPKAVVEQEVSTAAVQDDSQSYNSTRGSSS
jgi:hypothetical protein